RVERIGDEERLVTGDEINRRKPTFEMTRKRAKLDLQIGITGAAGALLRELRQLDALLLEQHGNAVADRIGQLAVARHQPLRRGLRHDMTAAVTELSRLDQRVRALGAVRRHHLQRQPRDRAADDVEQRGIKAHVKGLLAESIRSTSSGTGSYPE